MKLYCGTTDRMWDQVLKHGLYDWEFKRPVALFDSFGEAALFARIRTDANPGLDARSAELQRGQPIVVEVDVRPALVFNLKHVGLCARAAIPAQEIVEMTTVSGTPRGIRKTSLFYPGFMGLMETAKFLQTAPESAVSKFEALLNNNRVKEAWLMVESFLGLPHHELVDQPPVFEPWSAEKEPAQMSLFSCVARYDDPALDGLSINRTLTTDRKWAFSQRGMKVVQVYVPASMVEPMASDNLSDFFVAKAYIPPQNVLAVFNPWSRTKMKVTSNAIAFSIDNVAAGIPASSGDEREMRRLVGPAGELRTTDLRFADFVAPYVTRLLAKSSFDASHILRLFRHGRLMDDGMGNYLVLSFGQRKASEEEKTLTLTVGDIVKDVNTEIEGEVIAVSKMHHEADIDIVVRFDEPINGQKVFEVHPNEIEFVRHKTEAEILKDVDYRYYDESKMLKSRIDYGVRQAADEESSTWSPKIVRESYTPSTDFYEAAGSLEWSDVPLHWAVNNDTEDGSFQFIDPAEVADDMVDFRAVIDEQMNPGDVEHSIAEASDEILALVEAQYDEVKSQEQIRRVREAPAESEQKKTEAPIPSGQKQREEIPEMPAGLPTEQNPDRNGYVLLPGKKECRRFSEAYSYWSGNRKTWRVLVWFSTWDAVGYDAEDYLQSKSLCAEKKR